MTSLEFLYIPAFWAMLGVPLIVGMVLWGLRRRENILKEFGRMDLLAQFSQLSLGRKTVYRILPATLCFVLLVITAARPLLIGISRKILKGSLDVVAVLDVSKSMGAEDCGPETSRLDVAKAALLQCLPDLSGNRLGLVTFAGKSFPQAELTGDLQALRFVLKNWVTVDSAPSQGSNFGMALSEAIGLFDSEDRKRVILFFSDGGHVRPGNLSGLLTDIRAKGIAVVSVGIGTKEGSKIPVYEDGTFTEWLKIDGKEVVTQLNDDVLREISQNTNGKYLQLQWGGELKGVLSDPRIVGAKVLSGGREVFQIPLALAIGVFALGLCFERRKG